MAPTAGKLEALITPPETWTATLTESLGGGPQVVTINTTDVAYWSSAPAGADFAARMKTALEAASTAAGNGNTYTVQPDADEGGNGLLEIEVSAGTFTLVWVSTDWRDLCGFTGDLAPTAALFFSDLHVQALWLPGDRPAQVTLVGAGHEGVYETDAVELTSRSGHQTTLFSFDRRVLTIEWTGLKRSRVWYMPGADENEAYETFWQHAVLGKAVWAYVGDRIRFHWDADDAVFMTGKVQGGALKEIPAAQLIERYHGQWGLVIDRFMRVP